MVNRATLRSLTAFLALGAAACGDSEMGSLNRRASGGPGDQSARGVDGAGGSTRGVPGDLDGDGVATKEEERIAEVNACAATQRKYVGLGGVDLTASRAMAVRGEDRFRLKPYTALIGEFKRVLGTAPPALVNAQDAFSAAPARWFVEPTASAVTLYTTYAAAFRGALPITNTSPQYATAPTDSTAGAECAAFMRKAWSRTPSTQEIDACKTLAITGAEGETDARRKWAHALASVITATGFTTY